MPEAMLAVVSDEQELPAYASGGGEGVGQVVSSDRSQKLVAGAGNLGVGGARAPPPASPMLCIWLSWIVPFLHCYMFPNHQFSYRCRALSTHLLYNICNVCTWPLYFSFIINQRFKYVSPMSHDSVCKDLSVPVCTFMHTNNAKRQNQMLAACLIHFFLSKNFLTLQ